VHDIVAETIKGTRKHALPLGRGSFDSLSSALAPHSMVVGAMLMAWCSADDLDLAS
jgi:hypothetical protein